MRQEGAPEEICRARGGHNTGKFAVARDHWRDYFIDHATHLLRARFMRPFQGQRVFAWRFPWVGTHGYSRLSASRTCRPLASDLRGLADLRPLTSGFRARRLATPAWRVQETLSSLINTPIHRVVGRRLCVLTLSKGFHRAANRFRAFLNSS